MSLKIETKHNVTKTSLIYTLNYAGIGKLIFFFSECSKYKLFHVRIFYVRIYVRILPRGIQSALAGRKKKEEGCVYIDSRKKLWKMVLHAFSFIFQMQICICYVRTQGKPPPNLSQWRTDYQELKLLEEQLVQEGHFECGKEISPMKGTFVLWGGYDTLIAGIKESWAEKPL